MKIIPCAQGSTEWLFARLGIPTASEFDALVTPKGKLRDGQTPKTYLAKKLAEWWQGAPLFGGGFWNADQGHILEAEALPWYQLEYGQEITRVGFITSDDGRIGCSPDGLIGDSAGIEAKCPEAHTHTAYLLAGKLPDDYIAQVQGSMFVTGLNEWRFLSYRRRFPNLVLTIEQDEDFQEVLSEALGNFMILFDEGKARLTEINGGPPVWPKSDDSPNPVYHIDEPEPDDIGIIP